MSKTFEQIATLFAETNWEKDQGAQPGNTMSDGERRVVSLHMAIIAAYMQMVNEGILPPAQHGHYMLHLQDFAARLYAGETLKLKAAARSVAGDVVTEGTSDQSFRVDSNLGNIFRDVGAYALEHGKVASSDSDETGMEAQSDEGEAFDTDLTNDPRYQNLGKQTRN